MLQMLTSAGVSSGGTGYSNWSDTVSRVGAVSGRTAGHRNYILESYAR